MRKSVEQQLYHFFLSHEGEQYASGNLQRMEFRNKNGTLATPRSLVRRLQELAEEGKIANVGTSKAAIYTLKAKPQPKYRYEEVGGIMREIKLV